MGFVFYVDDVIIGKSFHIFGRGHQAWAPTQWANFLVQIFFGYYTIIRVSEELMCFLVFLYSKVYLKKHSFGKKTNPAKVNLYHFG